MVKFKHLKSKNHMLLLGTGAEDTYSGTCTERIRRSVTGDEGVPSVCSIIWMGYSRFLKHSHHHGDPLPAPRRREAKKDDCPRIDHRGRVNSDDPLSYSKYQVRRKLNGATSRDAFLSLKTWISIPYLTRFKSRQKKPNDAKAPANLWLSSSLTRPR